MAGINQTFSKLEDTCKNLAPNDTLEQCVQSVGSQIKILRYVFASLQAQSFK